MTILVASCLQWCWPVCSSSAQPLPSWTTHPCCLKKPPRPSRGETPEHCCQGSTGWPKQIVNVPSRYVERSDYGDKIKDLQWLYISFVAYLLMWFIQWKMPRNVFSCIIYLDLCFYFQKKITVRFLVDCLGAGSLVRFKVVCCVFLSEINICGCFWMFNLFLTCWSANCVKKPSSFYPVYGVLHVSLSSAPDGSEQNAYCYRN